MQYRLSTIFLVFFFVAASLALFGTWGLWIAAVGLVAALAFNKAKTTTDGGIRIFYIILIGVICPGLLIPHPARSIEAARRANCMNNMRQIGLAISGYEKVHGHYPPVAVCGQDGKPLFSWLVEMLPALDRNDIYRRLKLDEPWDSPHNNEILAHLMVAQFTCPSDRRWEGEFHSDYVAIIGPGTIWGKDGTMSAKDLPSPEFTVVAVECIVSDKHWAAPCAMTVEEAIERMKTGEGMRISSAHPGCICVLFADGHVECVFKDMPISLWRKLLNGEIRKATELEGQNFAPNDPIPQGMSTDKTLPESKQPSQWPYTLSILVWVVALLFLFYRAWDSRSIATKPTTAG